jgi:RNA polymerase sigma-70 factor (ECF subfamily)
MESLDVFEVLVRENGEMLTSFIGSSIRQDSAIDDIWQESMITAWRRWDDYDRDRPFGAWLRGIAGKNILAWHRKRARSAVSCDEATLEYFSDTYAKLNQLPGDTFNEKLNALRACIESLPENYRETIRLRFEDGLMPAALANKQSQNVETVKKQLNRAKAKLLDCITRKLAPSIVVPAE